MINNETICIYHKKSDIFYCPDGIGAAYAVWGMGCNRFLPGTYYNDVEIINQIGTGNKIFLVDYSMSATMLEELARKNNEVTVIDHHATGEKNLSQVSSSINKHFDMAFSGAYLTWKYFHKDVPVPAFIKYLQDGDLYQFNLPESKFVTAGLYSLMHYSQPLKEIFKNLDKIKEWNQDEMVQFFKPLGVIARENRELRIEKLMSSAYDKLINGHRVKVVEIDKISADLTSTIGYKLYTQYPEIDFAVIANQEEECCFVSFRSNAKSEKNFDCKSVAERFGGGGHRNACGCRVKKLEDLFDSKKI